MWVACDLGTAQLQANMLLCNPYRPCSPFVDKLRGLRLIYYDFSRYTTKISLTDREADVTQVLWDHASVSQGARCP